VLLPTPPDNNFTIVVDFRDLHGLGSGSFCGLTLNVIPMTKVNKLPKEVLGDDPQAPRDTYKKKKNAVNN